MTVMGSDTEGKIKKYVRAANYISAAQLYLQSNFLLERELVFDDIKPRLLGHWGTCPGINFIYAHLDQLEAGVIGDATGIAGPIAAAVHRLKGSDSKRKVLVLFTDGSNNIDARVSPRQAAKLAKTFNVIVYTVGIGSRNAFIVQNHPIFGRSLQQMGGEFDESLLKDIAKLSSGKYYTASDAKGLGKVMREIDKLEKTTKEQPRYVDYRELGAGFALWGLILVFLAFLLESTIAVKIP